MGGLAAALTHLAGLAQQPVEGRLRAQVDAFIEQDRPHLSRCEIGEPVAVQRIEDRLLLGVAQRPRLSPLPVRDGLWPCRWRALPVAPVVAGLRDTNRLAGGPHAQLRCQLHDG